MVDDQTSLSLATVSVAAVKHSRHSRQPTLNQRFHYTAKLHGARSFFSFSHAWFSFSFSSLRFSERISRVQTSRSTSRYSPMRFGFYNHPAYSSGRFGLSNIMLGGGGLRDPLSSSSARRYRQNGIDAESDFRRDSTFPPTWAEPAIPLIHF